MTLYVLSSLVAARPPVHFDHDAAPPYICQTSVNVVSDADRHFAHRQQCRVSYHGPELGWVTGHLMSPVHESAITCQQLV